MLPLNQIVHGDAEQVMGRFPAESIGLIVTSPPYNLKNSSGNGLKRGTRSGKWKNAALMDGYLEHDDCMPRDEYIDWQQRVLRQCMRVLRPDGAVFYNHKRRVQRGLVEDPQDIVGHVWDAHEIVTNEFPLRQIIIWERAGGMNFNPGYFLPTYEEIYLIAKPHFRLAPKMNKHGDVWRIAQAGRNPHPAPFPLELASRCITSVGRGPVLDPFMGSGTTAVAAALADLPWVGIEKSVGYIEMALERLGIEGKDQLGLFPHVRVEEGHHGAHS